ncbi:hypothetical protein EXIGLDRAFT_774734 [Exidia glandulosa HHB12029]|uniref:F-box domain-containing protein n=1 Tax=Exidia glandulosa HHB12029 TaxID=1314781 RepID=A0A165E8S8_EXIGL|nr:hypothetical protein EXIGLDRAFT_774734 [Exidia glandulosa HHB12029]
MLDALPYEIFARILAELPWKDILRAQTVSKIFRQVYESSSQLQYLVELGSCGLLPNSAQRISQSSADSLVHLDIWRATWRSLHPHAVDAVEFDGVATFCDMVDGVFVLGRKSQNHLTPTEFDIIDVVDTKSEERMLPSWTLEQAVPFVHMAIDPAQDLLVGIQNDITALPILSLHDSVYKMHVLSLSTGLPHPDAAHHVFPLSDYRMRRAESVRSDILGDFIAIHVCADSTSLLSDQYTIFNWRTGVTHLLYKPPRDLFAAFRLLSQSLFLMASRERTSNTGPHELFLSLHAFDEHASPSRNPPYHSQTMARFMLPGLAPRATMTQRFYFYLSNAASQRRGTAPFATLPFTPSPGPNNCVFALGMILFSRGVRPKRFTLFFIPGTLVRLATTSVQPGKIAAPEFAWDAWGADHTRLFGHVLGPPLEGPWPGPGAPRWLMGFRALLHRGQRVYDFNPYPGRRDPEDRDGLVDTPTVLMPEGIFARKVETRLPYREAWPRRPWNYNAMFLDEHIVGLKMNPSMMVPRRHEIESLDILLMMPEATHLLPISSDDELDDGELS